MSEKVYSCSKKDCYFCQEMNRLANIELDKVKPVEIDDLTIKYFRRKTRELLKKSA